MRFKKGGVYCVRMRNGQYFYIYYVTGGDVGDLIKVPDYLSDEIVDNVARIIEAPSLYADEYIIGFLDADSDRMSLVGHVSVDFQELMSTSFFTRRSIECSAMKESFNGNVDELVRRFESGEQFFCNDWRLEEHKIIGPKGKFDLVKEHYVGRLPKKYVNCFNSMIFPHIDDFIRMHVEGRDRNTMLSTVYR